MKSILFAALACVTFLPSLASAQINPKLLPGRWMMVSSSPSLESQTTEYAKFVGYSPSRTKELVDEIVRLSTQHGILTEYTAFLARDGEVFRPRREQLSQAGFNFDTAVAHREPYRQPLFW